MSNLAVVYSRTDGLLDAPLVKIETHASNGLPSFSIVGLPEKTVRESKDRVRSAIISSGYEFPKRRLTVNLAPADLPKHGSRYDLPIALSILAATQQIQTKGLEQYEFLGELSLTGEIKSIRSVLPAVLASSQAGRRCVIPTQAQTEARLINDAQVFLGDHLQSVCQHLGTQDTLKKLETEAPTQTAHHQGPDLSDVMGQAHGKKALEIAAAGGHNLLLTGPPGAGKSMLAKCLPGILPAMSEQEAVASALLYDLSGKDPCQHFGQRPFRNPHHSCSSIALIGSGSPPRPGEISLAHHGVLFLDELPEYDRSALEALREPLESNTITISRAQHQSSFPCDFQWITTMNPCPCGYQGSKQQDCSCSPTQIARYQSKISGPLSDRIDLQIFVQSLSLKALNQSKDSSPESSASVQKRVQACYDLQQARYGKQNAALSAQDLKTFASLKPEDENWLMQLIDDLKLSMRTYHRLLKVARTIADMESSSNIERPHLSLALSLRVRTL